MPEVDFWDGLYRDVREAIAKVIDRAPVQSFASPLVAVIRLGADDETDVGRLLGFAPEAGDDVWLIGDTAVGIVDDGSGDARSFDRPVILPAGSSAAAGIDLGGARPTRTDYKSQHDADTASTASTSTPVTAIDFSIALPAGTYTVRMLGGLMLEHSAGATAAVFPSIDGSAGTGRLVDRCPAVGGAFGSCDQERTGLAGGRTIHCLVQFRSSSAGTTSGRNPAISVTWERTDN